MGLLVVFGVTLAVMVVLAGCAYRHDNEALVEHRTMELQQPLMDHYMTNWVRWMHSCVIEVTYFEVRARLWDGVVVSEVVRGRELDVAQMLIRASDDLPIGVNQIIRIDVRALGGQTSDTVIPQSPRGPTIVVTFTNSAWSNVVNQTYSVRRLAPVTGLTRHLADNRLSWTNVEHSTHYRIYNRPYVGADLIVVTTITRGSDFIAPSNLVGIVYVRAISVPALSGGAGGMITLESGLSNGFGF